ncbi:hypothetical protein NHX12_024264 [Muraenolepis orangiensis]|uniref:SRCR domain-containing protein n=1 Tax=Muraenolepis orangiensis TaxID=630683 RepID=A0A9Q0EQG7_9TELE|nr:hypothetical protein NHX12_024264 [Muraenolepis orangiensis]
MKWTSCLLCVLASCLCQDSVRVVQQHATPCTWSLEVAGSRSPGALLGPGSREQLLGVCEALGCGGLYAVTETPATNGTDVCLTDCSYRGRRLVNCTLQAALGSHQVARLAGGPHGCGGRVELWSDGGWGTVCDDRWDLAAGHVVCGQLGCGYAVSVSGQGGPFPPAAGGPVYLDELMCTGTESSLWACPVAPDDGGGGRHDCGHKEDAAVMRAVRLTGGADPCSGRVEVHLNGTWGTVCDTCWDRQAASMVCSMLEGCGPEPERFSYFEPALGHGADGPLWFFVCVPEHAVLWDCREYVNVKHFCVGSKAAGLVCKATLPAGNATGSGRDPRVLRPISLELIGCVALSVVLLVMLTANSALSLVLKSSNDYRDSTCLVHMTPGPAGNPGHGGEDDEDDGDEGPLYSPVSPVSVSSSSEDYYDDIDNPRYDIDG